MNSIGDRGENIVNDFLNKLGYESNINNDVKLRYDYDIKFKSKEREFTCEVKYDLMAEKTGNLAIEVHNTKSDKPSGINSTKSDLWTVVLSKEEKTEIWMCSVLKLRLWLDNNKPKKTVNFGGDKNAKLLLYPKEKILSEFKRVDELDKKEFNKWLIQEIK